LRSRTLAGTASAVLLLAAALTASAGPASAAGDPEPYIIGGSDATQPYPFAARLLTEYPGMGTARCTATLVTDRGRTGVVTAAHCASDLTTALAVPAGNVTRQVGSNRLDKLTSISVSRVEMHSSWDWAAGLDLAVLVLPRGSRLTGIPLGNFAGTGREVRLLGWGMDSIGAPSRPRSSNSSTQ
jgi:secreted trypsin-like serine protease